VCVCVCVCVCLYTVLKNLKAASMMLEWLKFLNILDFISYKIGKRKKLLNYFILLKIFLESWCLKSNFWSQKAAMTSFIISATSYNIRHSHSRNVQSFVVNDIHRYIITILLEWNNDNSNVDVSHFKD